MLTIKPISLIALALPLVVLTGCPDNNAAVHPDPQADAGNPDTMAPPIDVNVPRNPLGTACSSNTDCTSGFCTDGVCCDSACGQTCYACSLPACKLVDGSTCQVSGDCISGHCLTYYVDADGDGYGTSEQAHFCEELNAAPPRGYAAYSGDCCDLDSGANPGFDSAQFLTMPDACGSFDWNCNGVITQQRSCNTGAVACGQDCTFSFLGSPITLFTEACN